LESRRAATLLPIRAKETAGYCSASKKEESMKMPVVLVRRSTLEKERQHRARLEADLSATKEDLEAAKRKLRELDEEVKRAQVNATKAHCERDDAFAKLSAANWTHPRLWELPLSGPKGWPSVIGRTFQYAQAFLRAPSTRMASLTVPEDFKSRTSWALYWLLSHAAHAAVAKAAQGTNENAITTAFAAGLTAGAERYRKTFGKDADLEIGSAMLFEHLRPNLQEVETGADMVLVVSGEGLAGKGCAKLIWLQAKRYDGKTAPFNMTYGQKNSKHTTQCAALKAVQRPGEGSTAVYVHYAVQLPFVAAIAVDHLDSEGSAFDISSEAVRLQELLTAMVLSPDTGQFESVEDAATFLESVSRDCGLPLAVATLDTRGETFGHQLTTRLQHRERPLTHKLQKAVDLGR
jgi:hypothetical protein